MVSADERSNEFRTRVESLTEFVEAKEIPEVDVCMCVTCLCVLFICSLAKKG